MSSTIAISEDRYHSFLMSKRTRCRFQVRGGQSLGESSYEEKASILKLLASTTFSSRKTR